MTNSYDVDHGLSQCPPGPLEPVEIAQQDDTLARTGNTARDQEMYAAGIRTGEENAKHNAAIRASMPDGWELVTRKTCYALMHDGAVIATLAGPESETNAAIIARMLAAPGVSTVEEKANPNGQNVGQIVDDYIQEYELRGEDEEGRDGVYRPNETERYMIADAIYGLLAEPEFITAIAGMQNAPAAGDALDAERWRAFVGCARIRPLGSTGLEQPDPNHYAHMGLEIWTVYGRDYSPKLLQQMDEQNERGRRWLVMFADVAIAAQQSQRKEA